MQHPGLVFLFVTERKKDLNGALAPTSSGQDLAYLLHHLVGIWDATGNKADHALKVVPCQGIPDHDDTLPPKPLPHFRSIEPAQNGEPAQKCFRE